MEYIRRILKTMLVCVPIAGCTGVNPVYTPVALTSNSEFQDDVSSIQAEIDGLNLWDRAQHVMTISDTRCDRFFEELDAISSNTNFGKGIIAGATTATPPLLQAAGASSLSVAAVPAALGFLTTAITSYEDSFLLAKFNKAVHDKWQAAREQAEADIAQLFADTENGLVNEKWVSEKRVDRELYKYSKLCLRSQLVLWLEQAASGGTVASREEEPASARVLLPQARASARRGRTGGRAGRSTGGSVGSYVVTRQ